MAREHPNANKHEPRKNQDLKRGQNRSPAEVGPSIQEGSKPRSTIPGEKRAGREAKARSSS